MWAIAIARMRGDSLTRIDVEQHGREGLSLKESHLISLSIISPVTELGFLNGGVHEEVIYGRVECQDFKGSYRRDGGSRRLP